MALQFTCRCGKVVEVPDSMLGRKAKCPECEKLTLVTQADASRVKARLNSTLYVLILVAFILAGAAYLIYEWVKFAEESHKIHEDLLQKARKV